MLAGYNEKACHCETGVTPHTHDYHHCCVPRLGQKTDFLLLWPTVISWIPSCKQFELMGATPVLAWADPKTRGPHTLSLGDCLPKTGQSNVPCSHSSHTATHTHENARCS